MGRIAEWCSRGMMIYMMKEVEKRGASEGVAEDAGEGDAERGRRAEYARDAG